MTNIVALNVPAARVALDAQTATAADVFASHRRLREDVFWLKENAEFLNIHECAGVGSGTDAVLAHRETYRELSEKISFFPQYYRFFLSICLDLEDLGHSGQLGEKLCRWVQDTGLPEAELSDLQRAEAQRLLARRDVHLLGAEALNARLRRFISRPATFALPNKKAGYELTHIVFYLSEYGRRDPQLTQEALQSLRFAGVLAYLDRNADLLAEICIALRFAGAKPSVIWENWVCNVLTNFTVQQGEDVNVADDYHCFFVAGWLARLAKREVTSPVLQPKRTAFTAPRYTDAPLRSLSSCLLDLGMHRRDSWDHMAPHFDAVLTEAQHHVVEDARLSIPDFDAFFAHFSRMSFAV